MHTTRTHWFYLILHGHFIMDSCKNFLKWVFDLCGGFSKITMWCYRLDVVNTWKCTISAHLFVHNFPLPISTDYIHIHMWWNQKRCKITFSEHMVINMDWEMCKQVGPFVDFIWCLLNLSVLCPQCKFRTQRVGIHNHCPLSSRGQLYEYHKYPKLQNVQ